MSLNELHDRSRRDFLCEAGMLAGAAALGTTAVPVRAADKPALGELPRRVLGRTKLDVTACTLGSAPCGIAPSVTIEEIARIVNVAIDEGVNFIDTAPKYVKAERGIGLALGNRRKNIYLATKVWCDTIADAEQSLANSLKVMKTDYVDVLYYTAPVQ